LELLYRVGVCVELASVGLDLLKKISAIVLPDRIRYVQWRSGIDPKSQKEVSTYNALAVRSNLLVPVTLALLLLLDLLVLDAVGFLRAALLV